MDIPIVSCTKCQKEYPQTEEFFHVRKKNPLILRKDCKECVKQRGDLYREENRDKVLAGKRLYYKNNKDKVLEYQKEYYEREEVKERQKEYNKEHRKTEHYRKLHKARNEKYLQKHSNDPVFKTKRADQRKKSYYNNLEHKREISRKRAKLPEVKAKTRERYKLKKTEKSRLRNAIKVSVIYYLKKRGFCKNGSLTKFLGYSFEDLKNHLESKFEPWMTWDNWSRYNAETWDDNNPSTWTWQVDHLVPHSTFNYDSMEHPDFKDCWALSNLRPLSAKQNLLDGVTRARHNQ